MNTIVTNNSLHFSIWIDDVREPPQDGREWVWDHSVNEAKETLKICIQNAVCIEVIDMDHDAGDYAKDGGDYIELLNWLEEIGCEGYTFHIHSMNPVGAERMRTIIKKNNWNLIE